MKKIPYGIASYKRVREEDCYYIDKTRYIPELEKAGDFLFLIRPRRFGKSSLLTLLECYYDIARPDEFDFLFGNTWIGKNPTAEKNSQLILKFNFSQVSPDPKNVEASFRAHTDTVFLFFAEKYRNLLGDDWYGKLEKKTSPHGKLEFLFYYAGFKGLKIYLQIDEYDNFANTILTTAGPEKYHELTHGSGFFRFFFNVMKGAGDQAVSGLGRIFITGVSPAAMDDVTSGFNIGRNISLSPNVNGLLGFTRQDVLDMMECYSVCARDAENAMALMTEWYDHYRFSAEAEETLFNTDMVLYFMGHFLNGYRPPSEMIDQNVRMDYGKLRHFVVLDRQLNGNFSYPTYLPECDGFLHNPLRGGNGQGLRRLVAGAVYGKISRGLLRISDRIEIRGPKGIYGEYRKNIDGRGRRAIEAICGR